MTDARPITGRLPHGSEEAGVPAAPMLRRSLVGRAWSTLVAAWGVVTGVAPHVLHHVGPLAGTALVSGAGGQVAFGAVGLAATVPLLLRLCRRFGTWLAPAIALVVFAAMYTVSTLFIGPLVSGDRSVATLTPAEQPSEAEDHHGHN